MNVDTAKAIRVTEDRDARVVFDVSDQLVGTTRYDEIDMSVEFKKRSYDVSSSDELDRGVRD